MVKRNSNPALSFSTGEWGRNRVSIRRDFDGAYIYARARGREWSLRTTDWEEGKRLAEKLALKIRSQGELFLNSRVPKVGLVMGLYLKHHSPRKAKGEQKSDKRRVDLWIRFLGKEYDLSKLDRRKWEEMIDLRTSGAITSRGHWVPEDQRDKHKVRAATVGADLNFLRSVCNWATKEGPTDNPLMKSNPTLRFEIPSELNPRRPVETEDRFQKVRAKAAEITMEVTWSGKARDVPTYLPVILDVANGTGRRVNAILALRIEDLRFDEGPCGLIRWPATTDKKKQEWTVPISPEVRAAIDAQLERRAACEYMSTSPWLFPAPRSLKKHVRMETATAWLNQAQELAEVPKLERGNWHPFRRKWASERKHVSHVDAAAAGGWKDVRTFTDCYAQADLPTMYEVVTNAKPRKEDFGEDD